jgi:hypothetical protein
LCEVSENHGFLNLQRVGEVEKIDIPETPMIPVRKIQQRQLLYCKFQWGKRKEEIINENKKGKDLY